MSFGGGARSCLEGVAFWRALGVFWRALAVFLRGVVFWRSACSVLEVCLQCWGAGAWHFRRCMLAVF